MKKNILTILTFVAACSLAAIGCWFLWHYPTPQPCAGQEHDLFMRQLRWHAIGIVSFVWAMALGWKRWLKAAPWIAVAWIVLLGVALVAGQPTHGAYKFVRLGQMRFNMLVLLWPVAALFVGWLFSRRLVKPWMVYAAIGLFLLFTCYRILSSPYRTARIVGFLTSHIRSNYLMFLQQQSRTAIEASNWFGSAELSLRYLPCASTSAILAGIATILGKWASVCAVMLMGLIGGCLVTVRKMTADPAKRAYVVLFGAILLGAAAWNCLQSLLLVPSVSCSFSLLSYGGTDVIFTWLGLGIALSTLRESETASDASQPLVAWGVTLASVIFLASAFCWAPVPMLSRFYEPSPNVADFGEYGIQPVHGEILAADGSPLATSFPEWQLHVDPQAVRYERWLTTNRVVEAVSRGLDLTTNEVSRIYANSTSRYVPVFAKVEGKTLKWCQDKWNNRRYGLVLEKRQKRHYPLGADAAAVTGFCSYDGNGLYGAAGLEYVCRKTLEGVCGKMNAWDTLAEKMRTGKPTNGISVKTTIRVPLQKAVSGILNAAAVSNNADTAWAIAVKIPKGEILALSSYPTFDPNASKRTIGVCRASANGAFQSVQEPGGLIKPIAFALAIDAGCVKPGEIHGWDNAVFTNLCHTIGAQRIWQGLAKFGFGQKLGEGLLYGETAGMLPRPAKSWSTAADCYGIGQGVAVTGVQLAQAYATLANGGIRVTPYLIEPTAAAEDGGVPSQPVRPEQRIVSATAAEAVTQALLAQTNVTTRVADVSVAVKTSSFALLDESDLRLNAHYSSTNFNAMCVGYFPAEKPTCVVLVGFAKPRPDHAAERVAMPVLEQIVSEIRGSCQTSIPR